MMMAEMTSVPYASARPELAPCGGVWFSGCSLALYVLCKAVRNAQRIDNASDRGPLPAGAGWIDCALMTPVRVACACARPFPPRIVRLKR